MKKPLLPADAVKLEILEYSYWEHFKYVKDLSLILPPAHPKRQQLEQELSKLLNQIHKIKNQ